MLEAIDDPKAGVTQVGQSMVRACVKSCESIVLTWDGLTHKTRRHDRLALP